MKFIDAVESYLNDGKKIARREWKDLSFLQKYDGVINLYKPIYTFYIYDNSILLSDGWRVKGKEGTFKFYEILDYLKSGIPVYLDEWIYPDSYIIYSPADKNIVLHKMEKSNAALDIESTFATDWVVVNYETK